MIINLLPVVTVTAWRRTSSASISASYWSPWCDPDITFTMLHLCLCWNKAVPSLVIRTDLPFLLPFELHASIYTTPKSILVALSTRFVACKDAHQKYSRYISYDKNLVINSSSIFCKCCNDNVLKSTDEFPKSSSSGSCNTTYFGRTMGGWGMSQSSALLSKVGGLWGEFVCSLPGPCL